MTLTSIRAAAPDQAAAVVESSQAWLRLVVCLIIGAVGGVGMWSFIVSLPAVQADFGVIRADASLPYTSLMIGFALGGVVTGYLADRFGVAVPLLVGSLALSLGYVATAFAGSLLQVALAHGALIGFGTSTTFGPLVADISHWFTRRRGIAVAICACGGYLAGVVWPPVVRILVDTIGWRHTHLGIGIFCAVTLLPLGTQTCKVLVVPGAMDMLPTDGEPVPDAEPLKFTASD